MITSSYRSGAWFGVFGSATMLLLPGSEKARVAGLWSRIDDGAGFDEVLDALLESGLGALPGFVLVSVGGGPTKLLARGAVLVTGTVDGEPLRIDGREALTWVERTLDAVESLSVVVGEAETDADKDDKVDQIDLPIVGGLVRVSRVDQPAASSNPAPAVVPVSKSADAGPLDEPIDPPDVAWAPPPGEAEAEAPDHDGLTTIGGSDDGFARDLPGIPGQPPAPKRVASVARLVISNGESVDVDRVILVGRAPEARRLTGSDQPRLIKVPSPLHEISSTHLEIRPGSGADHGSAVVTDMGSTNGTVLDQPGLGPESLKAGVAVQLIPGATVNLGDGVTIQIARP